jgi:hypothetical protein
MRSSNIDKLEAELERELYEKFHRFLRHISLDELRARYLAIRRHSRLAEIAANAELELWNTPIGDYRNPLFWVRKELLTVEEFRLRGEVLPGDPIVPVGVDHVPRPVSLESKKSGGAEFLVKYAKCHHLVPMLKHGAIRLNAAGYYKEKENNEARLDDELNKHNFTLGERVKVIGPTGEDIPVKGNLRYTKTVADYYILCMSNDFEAALFKAFESDGCLVIHDPKEFAFRLEKATRLILPDWEFGHSVIEYYDPYELESGQRVHAVMSKALNFVYQKEYRFFWVSRRGERPQEFLDVEIGSLKDIAELVRK